MRIRTDSLLVVKDLWSYHAAEIKRRCARSMPKGLIDRQEVFGFALADRLGRPLLPSAASGSMVTIMSPARWAAAQERVAVWARGVNGGPATTGMTVPQVGQLENGAMTAPNDRPIQTDSRVPLCLSQGVDAKGALRSK